MLSIKESKMLLAQLGLTQEQTDEYENLIAPCIDFHKYLMEKLDISSEAAEKISEVHTKKYVTEKIDELSKNENFDFNSIDETFGFKLASEALKQLALNNGYDDVKANELEKNMNDLLELLVKTLSKKTL